MSNLDRGGGKRREDWVRELADGDWNLHALLEAHDALLDDRSSVRSAAYNALLSLAEKEPDPVEVTPLSLLYSYAGLFTVASGMNLGFYRFLVDSDIEEGERILRGILSDPGGMRNQDFEWLVRYIVAEGKEEYLQELESADLSKNKGKIFRKVKREIGAGSE